MEARNRSNAKNPARPKRRGDSVFDAIGGLVVLVLFGSGIWWFMSGQGSFPPNPRAMTEPPVRVNLQGFVFSQGYYVFIFNTHETVILEGVSVEYTDVNGKLPKQ